MPDGRLKVKVCGMRDPDSIRDLSALPIDYIGFIFYPKSPRFVDAVPPVAMPSSAKRTGVFVDERESAVRQRIGEGLEAVQLHGSEPPEFCRAVRETGAEVIKAFGIRRDFDWETLGLYRNVVDYFLFDTASPQHGGTGKTFDWAILRDYPLDKPYFLSGGLDEDNIPQALAIGDSRLAGLDLNSQFELRPGLKDIEKLKKTLKTIENHWK